MADQCKHENMRYTYDTIFESLVSYCWNCGEHILLSNSFIPRGMASAISTAHRKMASNKNRPRPRVEYYTYQSGRMPATSGSAPSFGFRSTSSIKFLLGEQEELSSIRAQ